MLSGGYAPGFFTPLVVMLTMRPKPRAIIPSMTWPGIRY
jgi:hypothetical protein